jgi:hypothetical protein
MTLSSSHIALNHQAPCFEALRATQARLYREARTETGLLPHSLGHVFDRATANPGPCGGRRIGGLPGRTARPSPGRPSLACDLIEP